MLSKIVHLDKSSLFYCSLEELIESDRKCQRFKISQILEACNLSRHYLGEYFGIFWGKGIKGSIVWLKTNKHTLGSERTGF